MAYLINETCTACGACIDVCPTGALVERKKLIADGLAAGEKGKHDLELAENECREIVFKSEIAIVMLSGRKAG